MECKFEKSVKKRTIKQCSFHVDCPMQIAFLSSRKVRKKAGPKRKGANMTQKINVQNFYLTMAPTRMKKDV